MNNPVKRIVKHVIVYGDLSDGISTIVGPFDTHEDAFEFVEDHGSGGEAWCIIEMELP